MPANQPANHKTNGSGEKPSAEGRSVVSNDSGIDSSLISGDRATNAQDGNSTRKEPDRGQTLSNEFIDCRELARRWDVPVSWIRDQVRRRADDPLPHVNLGKYVRFCGTVPNSGRGLSGV